MRPLSASEAIGPAVERTTDLLARPFRLGTYLKIAAVAFFAEMGWSFNSSLPGRSNGLHGLPPALLAFFVAFALLLSLLSLVVGLILFYVGSRLQLVLVELVATRYTVVAPLWRKHGSRTWRWIGFKLLFFLCILLLSLPFVLAAIVYFLHQAHEVGALTGGNPFAALHLVHVLLFIAIAFLVVTLIGAVYLLVRDLALPYLALEDLGIAQSLARLRALLAAEPGQVLLYVLLRLFLSVVLGIVAEIAVALVLLLSLIPPGIVGGILWLSLHKAGTAGIVLLIVCASFGALVFLCWAVCVALGFIGALFTFFQAYALYFLGGRYPLLGDLLDRSTPPPAYAEVAHFSPPPPYQPPPPHPPTAPLNP